MAIPFTVRGHYQRRLAETTLPPSVRGQGDKLLTAYINSLEIYLLLVLTLGVLTFIESKLI